MRTLLVGAGPAGLAAAYCLKQEGVPYRWVDKGGWVGGTYTRAYPGTTLASPTRYTGLPGLAPDHPGEYITVGEYGEYLRRYAALHELAPETGTVDAIEKKERFEVGFAGKPKETFDAVVIATGMRDHPWVPSIPGLSLDGDRPKVLHARDWQGTGALAGKKVLIIGAATSAVELAEECAGAGIEVAVSARGRKVLTTPQRVLGRDVHDFAVLVERLPWWVAPQYCRGKTLPGTDLGFHRYARTGRIRVLPETVRFVGPQAAFQDGTQAEFDVVVLATGYRFQTPFLPSSLERTKKGHPRYRDLESRDWPGLYFLGFPCSRGLDSQFLRGVGRDAPVLARRLKTRSAHA